MKSYITAASFSILISFFALSCFAQKGNTQSNERQILIIDDPYSLRTAEDYILDEFDELTYEIVDGTSDRNSIFDLPTKVENFEDLGNLSSFSGLNHENFFEQPNRVSRQRVNHDWVHENFPHNFSTLQERLESTTIVQNYIHAHQEQDDFLTGENRYKFLPQAERDFYNNLNHENPGCPSCVFLGKPPSRELGELVLASAAGGLGYIGGTTVGQDGNKKANSNDCQTDYLSSASILGTSEPLDICLLPVVGLIKSEEHAAITKAVCAGTIIGGRAILTAAHCACLQPDKVIFGTGVPQSNNLWQRDQNFSSLLSQSQKTTLFSFSYEVDDKKTKFFYENHQEICEKFKNSREIPDNLIKIDLALMFVKNESLFPPFLASRQARFPYEGETLRIDDPAIIAGFGPDGDSYLGSHEVIKRYAFSFVKSSDPSVTVVGADGRHAATCSGDSGSGLYGIRDGELIVHGVLSSGRKNCGSKDPRSNYAGLSFGSPAHAWLASQLK